MDSVEINFKGEIDLSVAMEDKKPEVKEYKILPHFFVFVGPVLTTLSFFTIHYDDATFETIFFVGAILGSLFYSIKAFEIHGVLKGFNKYYISNQYWLNFLGALVGWIAFYYLLVNRWEVTDLSKFNEILSKIKLETQDGFLLLVSFLGMTGYVPYFVLLGKGSGK